MIAVLAFMAALAGLCALTIRLGDRHPVGWFTQRMFGLDDGWYADELDRLPRMARALDATGGDVALVGKRATRPLPALGRET